VRCENDSRVVKIIPKVVLLSRLSVLFSTRKFVCMMKQVMVRFGVHDGEESTLSLGDP
jgi:hypothetical protein